MGSNHKAKLSRGRRGLESIREEFGELGAWPIFVPSPSSIKESGKKGLGTVEESVKL